MLLKVLFPGRLERFSMGLYLVSGWVGLVGIEPLAHNLPWPALALFGTGGLLFSLGVLFHLWRRLPYHNFIWHLFVIGGATAHYFLGDLFRSADRLGDAACPASWPDLAADTV
jgi:hemolysin III